MLLVVALRTGFDGSRKTAIFSKSTSLIDSEFQLSIVNVSMLRRVADKIQSEPESYRQSCYASSCGSLHCIAGWVCVLSGCTVTTDTGFEGGFKFKTSDGSKVYPSNHAASILGLPMDYAMKMFHPSFEPGGEPATAKTTSRFLRRYADACESECLVLTDAFINPDDRRFRTGQPMFRFARYFDLEIRL